MPESYVFRSIRDHDYLVDGQNGLFIFLEGTSSSESSLFSFPDVLRAK